MKNLKILFKGLALAFKNLAPAVRLWTVNLLFSILVAAPLVFLMMRHMSHSFAGERALHKLDIFWLGDFVYRYMNMAPALTGLVLLGVILFLVLSVFLNGGVIGQLILPEDKTSLGDFYYDCGLYFWRFFRLFLLSIPVYLIVVGIFYPLLKAFLELFSHRAPTEWPALIVSNLRLLSLLLLLTITAMFFDYVKIGLAGNGRKKVLKEVWLTLKFLGRRFFRAWGLFLLAGLVFVALTIIYLEVARIMPKDRPQWVLLVFLWQQFYIFCRQWSKVLFFATEIEFMKQNQEPTQSA